MDTEDNYTEIEELEALAKDFIIGYVPLTEEQKEIILNIEKMQMALKTCIVRTERIERVIQALYLKLAELNIKEK